MAGQPKADDPEDLVRMANWVAEHRKVYISSAGREGHIVDLSAAGGYSLNATLLLKNVGRTSGRTFITPLVYGQIFGEIVVVGSKAGADDHPDWYKNIRSSETVQFQIATQAFVGSKREPVGDERERVFSYMIDMFPPFGKYRAMAKREIPLVMIKKVRDLSLADFSRAG